MKDIGTITIRNEDGIREVKITRVVRAEYKDHRLCTVAKTELGTYVLGVENPVSTGRATVNMMHLTEESMLALLNTVFVFFNHFDTDIEKEMEALVEKNQGISFEYADEETEKEETR